MIDLEHDLLSTEITKMRWPAFLAKWTSWPCVLPLDRSKMATNIADLVQLDLCKEPCYKNLKCVSVEVIENFECTFPAQELVFIINVRCDVLCNVFIMSYYKF